MRFEEMPTLRYIPLVYLESVLKQLEEGNIFNCPGLGRVKFGVKVSVRLVVKEKDEDKDSGVFPYWICNDTRRNLIKFTQDIKYTRDQLFDEYEVVRYIPENCLEEIREELEFSHIFTSTPLGSITEGYKIHVRILTGRENEKNGNETFYLLSDNDRRAILNLKL